MKRKISIDQLGMCASALCIVHCMAIPILLILGVDAMLLWMDAEAMELLLIGLSLVIGLISFVGGYLKHKHHFIPLLFLAGFLLMINGESISSDWLGVAISVFGAGIIIYAHFHNYRLRRYAA